MRKLLILTVLLLSIGGVVAQELTTGVLEGKVTTEDGTPVAEAVITLIGGQGTQTAVTDSAGRYSFRGLAPGKYQVKAEATGMGTVVQNDVEVFIARRTQLPFTLTAGQVEEVTVTSTAPMVDMKSTSTETSIKVADMMPYVPIGRNLVSTFAIAPGVSDGGSIGGANRSISGASGLENAYFVDGVNITNSGYGALGAYSIVYGSLGTGVTYDFLEEVQVKTGGFEAEFGQAGGGVVNSVVKSGTNTFTVDAAWYEEPTGLEGGRRFREITPNTADYTESLRRDIAVSAGGPILKDKLFFFAAYNPVRTEGSFQLTSGAQPSLADCAANDPNVAGCYDLDGDGNFTDTFPMGSAVAGGQVPRDVTRVRTNDNYAGKITWFATSDHKIELTAFGDPSDGDVGPQSPTQFLRALAYPSLVPDPTAGETGLDYGGNQYSLKYQGVWTSNFFTEVMYSHKRNTFSEIGPGLDFRSFFRPDVNLTYGGAGYFEDSEDKTDQYTAKFTYVVGPVELKAGYDYYDMDWRQPQQYSGSPYSAYFPQIVDAGGAPVPLDTDGDGVADTTADYYLAGDGSLAGSYTAISSSTGASVDDLGGGEFNVTRTAFQPFGQFTNATEKNAFAQVSWDVIPNVTVKAGLRWTEQELTGQGTFTLPFSRFYAASQDDFITTGLGSTEFTPQTYTFDSEIAPRIGVSWDILSNGKHKLYANYGEYYQRVPSDLAVRQFSNEVGIENELFADPGLTTPLMDTTCPADPDGDGIYEPIPCHGLSGTGFDQGVILDGTIDPSGDPIEGNNPPSKLPYNKEWLAGYAWQANDWTSLEVRYIHRELGRVLEDVQFSSNEQTWNQFFGTVNGWPFLADPFPGHGVGSFGAYVLANPGDNVDPNLFPEPVRDYDAFEVIWNRRFHNNWMAYVNYRLGRLRGNYEGSYRNDNGQSDPFITSLFDFPAASYNRSTGEYLTSNTMIGQFVTGPLNTDRRHILNAFLSRQFDFGLNVGGRLSIQSGQPRFPLFAHPTYRNAGEIPGWNPVYWWLVAIDQDYSGTGDPAFDGFGIFKSTNSEAPYVAGTVGDYDNDGVADDALYDWGDYVSGPRLFSYDVIKRDYWGRNPLTWTFDLHASYDWKFGRSKLTGLLDIFNLFSDTDALSFSDDVENRPGVPNPNFLRVTGYQAPRNVRLGVKYTW